MKKDKHNVIQTAIFTMLVLTWSAQSVTGGSLDLRWSGANGGGGNCAGAKYTLSGTIGQHDAGVPSGGSFTLAGGFWGVEAVAPELVPQLRIRLEGGGRVIISWPDPSTGFHLETANSLAQPAQWIDQGDVGTVVGNEKQFILPASAPSLFFRLRRS